ncbi:hypothetical protein NKG94_37770 [Micromonospora sp. M12]
MPVASNLNFVAGQTIPNLVMVPVVDRKVNIYNQSSGTVHVLADLAGYFGSSSSGADQTYVPYGPRRVADTGTAPACRTARWGRSSRTRRSASSRPTCRTPLRRPTKPVSDGGGGQPDRHQADQGRRPHRSPVRQAPADGVERQLRRRRTASNLAVIGTSPAAASLFNASSGSTDVIVDQAGYFIAAAS